jgi:hypothetical protein
MKEQTGDKIEARKPETMEADLSKLLDVMRGRKKMTAPMFMDLVAKLRNAN